MIKRALIEQLRELRVTQTGDFAFLLVYSGLRRRRALLNGKEHVRGPGSCVDSPGAASLWGKEGRGGGGFCVDARESRAHTRLSWK